jgi:hypothetical protein
MSLGPKTTKAVALSAKALSSATGKGKVAQTPQTNIYKVGEVACYGAEYFATALLRHLGTFGVLELAMQKAEEHVRLTNAGLHGTCFMWTRPVASEPWCLYVVRVA